MIAVGAMIVAVGFGVTGSRERMVGSEASSWRGLVGGARPSVAVGQRMLVVLKTPSLAQQVFRHGGLATERQERSWTRAAIGAQKRLLTQLAIHGIRMRPEFSFARVINGFSAPLDARAVALLERRPEVAGVYPVRVAYPAAVSTALLRRDGVAVAPGRIAGARLPGYNGRGVTIALLDTGVDRKHPYLRGRVEPGVDVLGEYGDARAAVDPDDPGRVEQHGTEIAGILVGAGGGPGGISGVATGASLMPVRVAGWQRDLTSSWAVYGRTDQIVAGLERAVDPNLDGDAHDAARVAVIGLAASYGAFVDSPEARATRGAMRLDTLVVAPAGNDGPAGPAFGSIASPGGAPDALTVGAADMRDQAEEVPVTVRAGLRTLLHHPLPLAGVVASPHPQELELVAPRLREPGTAGPDLGDFFDERGRSLVAGRAALVHAGEDPQLVSEYAVRAGAAAVVLYGTRLPAGGLGVDEDVSVPVVSLPARVARVALAALSARNQPEISIGVPLRARNGTSGEIAPFSSHGLAFDARVKPDLAAPGVAVATAEAARSEDGSPRFGTVNGSSAAAAVVAGAAAVLAQARPGLSAPELKSLLTGTARPLRGAGVAAQGAGVLDLGAASAAELATDPGTLAFGSARGDGWHTTQELTLQNASSRWLPVRVHAVGEGGLEITPSPARTYIRPGGTRTVRLRARIVGTPPTEGSAEGSILLIARGAGPLRVPWEIAFGAPARRLISAVALSATAFEPSDTTPAVLSLRAGNLVQAATGPQVEPVRRLDVELWRGPRRLGLLARLRDLLPGRVAIGLTGRNPEGGRLRRGKFTIRLVAVPTSGGPRTRQTIDFEIK
jgi:subtilisin family serine protease